MESLIVAVIGGIAVQGFVILLGAIIWIKQQNWNQRREIYARLFPLLTRFYTVNRLLVAVLRRAPNIEDEEVKRFLQWIDERQSLFERLDDSYGYSKLFISEESQRAITALLDSVREVSEGVKESKDFLKLKDAQEKIGPLADAAIKALFLSAKEDLRFAFEIPFTGYVIGEGTREPLTKSESKP